jgi:hypothetical protein
MLAGFRKKNWLKYDYAQGAGCSNDAEQIARSKSIAEIHCRNSGAEIRDSEMNTWSLKENG